MTKPSVLNQIILSIRIYQIPATGRKVASNCEDISVSMIDMDGRSVWWVYTEVTLHMQKEVFIVTCKTRKICQ